MAPRSWGTAEPAAVITATWSTPGREPLIVTNTATAAGQWSQPAPDLPAGTY